MYGKSFDNGRGHFLVAGDYRRGYENYAADLGLNDFTTPEFTGNETPADFDDNFAFNGENDYLATSGVAMGGAMGSAVPAVSGVSGLPDPLCGRQELLGDLDYHEAGEIVPAGITSNPPATSGFSTWEGQCADYPFPDDDGGESERYTFFVAARYDVTDRLRLGLTIAHHDRSNVNEKGRSRQNPFNNIVAPFTASDGSTITPADMTSIPFAHPGVQYNIANNAAWAAALGMGAALNTDNQVIQSPAGYRLNEQNSSNSINISASIDFTPNGWLDLSAFVAYGKSEARTPPPAGIR